MERKPICITNKDGATVFMSPENFRRYVEYTPGVTLKDETLYVEHDENVPYYNSELGDAIIKELKQDTPVAAFFRAISEIAASFSVVEHLFRRGFRLFATLFHRLRAHLFLRSALEYRHTEQRRHDYHEANQIFQTKQEGFHRHIRQ